MDFATLINNALVSGGVIQYPDKKLYKAAVALTPEERPKSPVRLLDAKHKNFERRRGGNAASAAFDNELITINREAPEYKDKALLAAIIAHEAEHEQQMGTSGAQDEGPAYQRQIDVLKRLNYNNPDYFEALRQVMNRHVEQDKKRHAEQDKQ